MGVTEFLSRYRFVLLPLMIAATGLACVAPCAGGPKPGAVKVLLQSSSTTTSGVERTGSADMRQSQSSSSVSLSAGTKSFSKPYGSHLGPILQNIGASSDQRKAIGRIVENYEPKIEPLRQEYKQKSAEFIDYIVTGKSAGVIMARQGELNNLYGVIVTEYSLMRMEIRRLLTPQQCRLFEEYRARQGWRSK